MKHLLLIGVLIGVLFSVAACDDTENANYSNFDHLCEDSDDMVKCVRDYFRKNARCSVIRKVDDSPVYRERHNAYLPNINLTLVTTQVKLSHMNGSIEKFYINKKSGNLVMTVAFKGVVLVSPVTYFYISQRGLEPKMVSDYANGTYPAVLTAVIPTKKRITQKTLGQSVVTAYLPEGDVRFYIGPKVTESDDPVVAAMVKGLISDVPTAVQEIFLTEAPNFFLAYLQKFICNFGIPLSGQQSGVQDI